MLARFPAYWDRLRSTLWFTPSIIVAVAIGLAWVALRLDATITLADASDFWWAFGGEAESARQLLATLAGSMVTLTGVTFSITLAALALAAGQYSPRVLRNFMRDRFNQTVLGVFIGTFVYCILLLRSIRLDDETPVSAFGVTGAVLFALVSLGFFIFFIHHIASSIQVSSMIHAISHETHAEIGKLFDRTSPSPVGPAWIGASFTPAPDGFRVVARKDGYVERIDTEQLCKVARGEGLVLDMLVGPGDFVTRGAPLAIADQEPSDASAFDDHVMETVFLGDQRTFAEDPSFGFRQLVDIAVRALSPGINDPTTACNAIDFLGSLLADMADRPWPATAVHDDDGNVRIRLTGACFADYVELAFTEIRRYGAGDMAVTLRLLDTLAVVASTTARGDRRAALWRQACAIVAGSSTHMVVNADRQRVDDALRRAAIALDEDPAAHLLARRAPT